MNPPLTSQSKSTSPHSAHSSARSRLFHCLNPTRRDRFARDIKATTTYVCGHVREGKVGVAANLSFDSMTSCLLRRVAVRSRQLPQGMTNVNKKQPSPREASPRGPPTRPATASCSSLSAASTACCVASSPKGSLGDKNVVPQNVPPGSNTRAISATAARGSGPSGGSRAARTERERERDKERKKE